MFSGFPKNVGFNDGFSAPQPDSVEGLEMEEYRPFPVDKYVNGSVLYKDNPGSVTLPHLAGEWKGPGMDLTGARLQGAHDGAALVYARNQALSLVGAPDPPGMLLFIPTYSFLVMLLECFYHVFLICTLVCTYWEPLYSR